MVSYPGAAWGSLGGSAARVRQDASLPVSKPQAEVSPAGSPPVTSKSACAERLWEGKSKTSPKAPDFKYKVTSESLWIDSCYDPGWFRAMPEKMASQSEGVHGAKALIDPAQLNSENYGLVGRELFGKNAWEMQSLEEALASLERGMPQLLSVEDFICILQKCRQKKNLAYAKRLHAYLCKSGLEDHKSLGNYLGPTLVECGSMCDAQHVFNRLADPNEHSWTSLIMGYIECGESQRALNLYQKMQEDGVCPSKYTFVALLKACARLKDAQKGQEIHAAIARKALESDPFLGNTLVDMYAKCNSLAKAREVFDNLPVRNIVSWTALISGYADHGLGEEALDCFKQMQLKGLSPNAVTFVCSLKACGSIGAIEKARGIHTEISRKSLDRDPLVGSTLVDMYAKCGLLAKAQDVFDKLTARDVVSSTALIAGYAEHGFGEEALNYYQQMQLEGVSPNTATLVCSLKACGIIRAIDKGREIHVEIVRKKLEGHPFVGNTLVDMYAKCGLLAEARKIFDKLLIQNVVSWNALIAGYAENGAGEEALNCLEQMQVEGILVDAVTSVFGLKACGSIGAIDTGQEIHTEIARKGFERDPGVVSTLVDMYAKCGFLMKATEAFDRLLVPNVAPWNVLIGVYAEYGLGEEALNCFDNMQLEGVAPDAVTFACILKACGSIGAIDRAQEIHTEVARTGLENDPCVGTTLVNTYAKCGLLAKAWEVFYRLPIRDVVLWTALMAGYAQLGESEIVFRMLEESTEEGIKPNSVTFVSAIAVCSHMGLVHEGQKCFEVMSKEYGIVPTIEHYTCMVDLLGRAGQLELALAMVDQMPFQPNLMVWRTVLGACQKWGNVELGRQAFEHAMQLDEKHGAAYIMMSNIYADAHMLLGGLEM